MQEVIIFIIAFTLPFFFYRIASFVIRGTFNRAFKIKNGMQIHHLHYGLVLIFVGTIILLFFGRNFWVIIFLGYGLGLAFDEFIGSLRLPEYRPLGLEIYKKAFKPTLALFLIVSLLLLGTALMYFYK